MPRWSRLPSPTSKTMTSSWSRGHKSVTTTSCLVTAAALLLLVTVGGHGVDARTEGKILFIISRMFLTYAFLNFVIPCSNISKSYMAWLHQTNQIKREMGKTCGRLKTTTSRFFCAWYRFFPGRKRARMKRNTSMQHSNAIIIMTEICRVIFYPHVRSA